MKKEEGLKKYLSVLLMLAVLIIILFLFSALQTPQTSNRDITGYSISIDECNHLYNTKAKDFCQGSIIVSKAMFTRNIGLCNDLVKSDEKSICTDSVLLIQALENKDKSSCNNILDSEIKNICLTST
ncbi:MAG: hypothetical protein V1663_00560 [archaeon]